MGLGMWSDKHGLDGCSNCGGSAGPHLARGMCSSCYRAWRRRRPAIGGMWSAKHGLARCRVCGTSDRRHHARGLCVRCWSEEKRRRQGKAVFRLNGRWSLKHDACVECGTTARPHRGHGMCTNCYVRWRRDTNPAARKQDRELSRDWYRRNRNKKRAKPNRAKANAANRRHKARKREAEGNITVEEWWEYVASHGTQCTYCGRDDVDLTMDHVEPLSRGGAHVIGNVVASCAACNSGKCASPLLAWVFRDPWKVATALSQTSLWGG